MRACITQEGLCWQSSLVWSAVLMALCTFNVIPVAAEELKATVVSNVDCRYEGIGTVKSDNTGSSAIEPFPENDLFRPLMADPKQPQFFASYQNVRVRDTNQSLNAAFFGVGESFGLLGKRNGCNGWQVGILGGVFAQFNLDSASFNLINADYIIGFPVAWRRGLLSTRVQLVHQSTHLGDEFLLGHPGVNRVNFSFEAVDALLSLDAPAGWGRVYAGGSYLIRREPATLDRAGVQWGVELRGPAMVAPILGRRLPALRLTPVVGADFKSFEELRWIINRNVVGGLEWSKFGGNRRLRLLVNYYHGFSPYGQFFAQKIETVGVGVYLSF